jgi:hypothetical protein
VTSLYRWLLRFGRRGLTSKDQTIALELEFLQSSDSSMNHADVIEAIGDSFVRFRSSIPAQAFARRIEVTVDLYGDQRTVFGLSSSTSYALNGTTTFRTRSACEPYVRRPHNVRSPSPTRTDDGVRAQAEVCCTDDEAATWQLRHTTASSSASAHFTVSDVLNRTDTAHVPLGVDVQIRVRWAAAPDLWSLWGIMVHVAPAASSLTFAGSTLEASGEELPDPMEGDDHAFPLRHELHASLRSHRLSQTLTEAEARLLMESTARSATLRRGFGSFMQASVAADDAPPTFLLEVRWAKLIVTLNPEALPASSPAGSPHNKPRKLRVRYSNGVTSDVSVTMDHPTATVAAISASFTCDVFEVVGSGSKDTFLASWTCEPVVFTIRQVDAVQRSVTVAVPPSSNARHALSHTAPQHTTTAPSQRVYALQDGESRELVDDGLLQASSPNSKRPHPSRSAAVTAATGSVPTTASAASSPSTLISTIRLPAESADAVTLQVFRVGLYSIMGAALLSSPRHNASSAVALPRVVELFPAVRPLIIHQTPREVTLVCVPMRATVTVEADAEIPLLTACADDACQLPRGTDRLIRFSRLDVQPAPPPPQSQSRDNNDNNTLSVPHVEQPRRLSTSSLHSDGGADVVTVATDVLLRGGRGLRLAMLRPDKHPPPPRVATMAIRTPS